MITDTDRRLTAVRRFGYSPKEAAFVTKAALHSGYFLRRQINSNFGREANDVCRKTVDLKHATISVYGNKTRVFHLSAKPLYCALGESENRHRRDNDTYRIRAKLMGFDYFLLNPEYRYLPTEQDKLDYFLTERGLPVEVLPTQVYANERGDRTRRFFIEKYPIRVDRETGHVAFCFIDTGVFTEMSFKTWLQKYMPILSSLESAEVVYVGDQDADKDGSREAGEREFKRQTATGRRTISVELQEYFSDRKSIEALGSTALHGWPMERIRLHRERTERYGSELYTRQYEVWKGSDAGPDGVAIAFSFFALPFLYSWLGTAGRNLK